MRPLLKRGMGSNVLPYRSTPAPHCLGNKAARLKAKKVNSTLLMWHRKSPHFCLQGKHKEEHCLIPQHVWKDLSQCQMEKIGACLLRWPLSGSVSSRVPLLPLGIYHIPVLALTTWNLLYKLKRYWAVCKSCITTE